VGELTPSKGDKGKNVLDMAKIRRKIPLLLKHPDQVCDNMTQARRSRSHSRSRRHSRCRCRSYSRSRSHCHIRSHSYSRSRSHCHIHIRSHSHSRSRSHSHCHIRSHSRSRCRSHRASRGARSPIARVLGMRTDLVGRLVGWSVLAALQRAFERDDRRRAGAAPQEGEGQRQGGGRAGLPNSHP
jgi:hypothetical protein